MKRITNYLVIALSIAVIVISFNSMRATQHYTATSLHLIEVVEQQQEQIIELKEQVKEVNDANKEIQSVAIQYKADKAYLDKLIKKLGGKPQDFQ